VARTAEVSEGIESLQSVLEERLLADLARPITDWRSYTIRLDQVMRAYKQARFDANVKIAVCNLHKFLRRTNRETAPEYWKGCTLVYELNDVFHIDDKLGEQVLRLGKRVQDELRRLAADPPENPLSDSERLLLREKILYCACRGNELKRAGDPESAVKLFESLLDVCITIVKNDEIPCYGTRATISYHLGSVYRALEQHAQAEDMYTQTIALLYERSKSKADGDIDDHFFSVRKQAMAIGIGFGWVNLTRGLLKRAEHALTTARSLLAQSSDPVIPSYIELLYGTITRCRAGTQPDKLHEAIKSLNHARQAFEKHGQTRYVPRACWELSLAWAQLGDFPAAEAQLSVVADYANRLGHPKWLTNVKILQSRMLRSRGDCRGALREARQALIKAVDCRSILPLVDARITLGEARLCIAEKSKSNKPYGEARFEFEQALALIQRVGNSQVDGLPSNPKIVAVCFLRIAQCYARQGDETNAKEFFAKWESLRLNVEHEWVRELAEIVKAETDGLLRNFVISATNRRELDYSKNVTRLRQWLLTQGLRHAERNYSEAARLIGVKRTTLYQWQKDNEGEEKQARTPNEHRRSAKDSRSKH